VKGHENPRKGDRSGPVFPAVEGALRMGCSITDVNVELLRHQVLSLQVINLNSQGVYLSHPDCRRDIILQNCDIPEGTHLCTGQWLDLELRIKTIQEGWCYWATMPLQEKTGTSIWSVSLTGTLEEPLRQALRDVDPRKAVLKVLRNAIKRNRIKKEVLHFAARAVELIEKTPNLKRWPGIHPLKGEELSVEKHIHLVVDGIQTKNLWVRLDTVEDLIHVLLEREVVTALIWSEAELNRPEWATVWKDWVKGHEFEGVIENIGSGYGFLRCEGFASSVFVLRDDVIEGDLITGALCHFQIGVVNYDGKLRFAAKQVRSEGRRVIETLPYWTMASPDQVSPKTVKEIKEELRQGHAVMVLFRGGRGVQDGLMHFATASGLSQKSVKWIDDVYPQLSLPEGGPWSGGLICRPNTVPWEELRSKRERNRAIRTLYTINAGVLAEQERSGWTILMDETGSCDDFRMERKGRASVMMALIVPPGVSLPPCPSGFHAYESPWEESEALRLELLRQKNVWVLGWSYLAGAPLEDQNLATSDFHAQMWRHAMDMCLELIAQRSSDQSQAVKVRFYLEQVGPLTPQQKGLFDDRMTSLLEACHLRPGWKNLKVEPPRIVSKDVHPWMGYVDVMGLVFRPSGEVGEALRSVRALRIINRVVLMDYRQDHMEALSQAIMLSARQPLSSLLLLASLEGAYLEGFEVVVQGLVANCIERLSDTEMMALHENLERILSRQPECYLSAEWICSHIPEELFRDKRYKPSLRLLGLTNKLLTKNVQGDTKGAFSLVEEGDLLCTEVRASGLRMRYYCEVAEAYSYALQMGPCLSILERHCQEAWDKVEDVAGAQRLLSLRMQVFGLMGKTQEALDIWTKLYPYLLTAADERRFQIFKAHLRIDEGQPGKAWMELQESFGDKGLDPLIERALRSRFLCALLLKLEVLCPRLSRKQKKVLLAIDLQKGYPWLNIAYWGLQLDMGEGRQKRLEGLVRILTEPTKSASMEMIRYCFWTQLIVDGQVDGQLNFDLRTAAAKKWLIDNPMNPDMKRGMLMPLRFNYC
jgi:hypothetical protein